MTLSQTTYATTQQRDNNARALNAVVAQHFGNRLRILVRHDVGVALRHGGVDRESVSATFHQQRACAHQRTTVGPLHRHVVVHRLAARRTDKVGARVLLLTRLMNAVTTTQKDNLCVCVQRKSVRSEKNTSSTQTQRADRLDRRVHVFGANRTGRAEHRLDALVLAQLYRQTGATGIAVKEVDVEPASDATHAASAHEISAAAREKER